MQIEYDPAKRDATLLQRGLDMADAVEIFESEILTVEDDRIDYGEPRFLTVGYLRGRMMFVAWTPRGSTRRVISMRKANEREIAKLNPSD
ncbi:BrnT family toxin [Cypionkella sp.]|uniref:BrnT family toxin n=1 Tax=Cypionkella sp. TaxID=2811411 RepID=UPI002ABB8927|nr:BrnT family toxin [Cypionkella sp.]MDZ4393740.1 BrnT family toxin [Cypionkella sp.]